MQKQEIALKVMEAHQEEAYRGIVRIDSETMNLIGVGPGDILEIEGGRVTVAIANRAYPSDVGQKVIRMDGIIRRNAKTGIGETVRVRKADIVEAKSITIAPAQKGVMVQAHPDVFKRGLLGRAVVKGDIVSLGGARSRRRTLSESPFFDDIFNVFEEGFMGNFGFGSLRFIVADTAPKQPVIITEATKITINPKAVEVTEELIPEVTYEDIGGLDQEILSIREMVELPLRHPEIFKRLGIEPPAGVLLHGSPGTGKTLLAKAVANESEANFILINGPEIMNKFYGECVSADSLVFTNGIGLTTIEEVIKSGGSHKIAGLDMKDKKVKMLSITDNYDKGVQDTLKISTKNNSLTLTTTSRLLTKENKRLKWIFAHNLKIGNKVAIAKDWPKKRVDNKVLWSSIKIIEKSKAHVYDFTVPNDHNFIANGFIVHNSEKRVRDVFEEAEKNAPSIIFIDEIDAIAPKREETHGELERRVVATLLTQMDGLKSRGRVVVIAATNRPNAVDPALRRPGRFDREIAIGIPDKRARLEVLKVHTRNMPLDNDVNLKEIASITHGFVGADLSSLAKEAAMNVLRRLLPEIKLREKEPIPKEILDKLIIREKDFKAALRNVRPSAMREVLVEVPSVHWNEVGGLENIKQELKEAVEWPLKHAAAFKRLGIRPPKGILLYGPPGTGKTLLAKAIATESEANFIQVKGPELLNKFVGETEKGVRKIFEKARQTAPTIIFFDEIDSIAPRRGLEVGTRVTETTVNTILAELDGIEDLTDIIVIAATNRPDMLDTALLRPGRFDRILLINVPDEKARLEIFKIHTEKMPLTSDVDIKKLTKETQNYAGSDIEAVCREAGLLALRDNIKSKEVPMKYFELALQKVKPSIREEDIERYRIIEEKYIKTARGAAIQEIPSYLG